MDATEWMQPHGCHYDDLNVPLGPMTRSKQARFQQDQLLHTPTHYPGQSRVC